MKTLRWKKMSPRMCKEPRGSYLWDGETKYACIYAHDPKHFGKSGWFWITRGPMPYRNTCDRIGMTEDDCKYECKEFVKAWLEKQNK